MSSTRPDGPSSARRRLLLAIAAVAAIYVLTALSIEARVFWMPDSGAKFLETASLGQGTLRWGYGGLIDSVAYPGQAIDPHLRLVSLPFSFRQAPDGRFYSWFPVWFAGLSWLPLQLFGLRGLQIIPAAAGVACAALAGAIAEGWSPGRGWLAALLTGTATPLFFYSIQFWEHSLAAALALAGLWLALRSGSRAQAAGLLLLVLAAIFRREMALALACGGAWLVYGRLTARQWAPAAGWAAAAAGLLGLSQLMWGTRAAVADPAVAAIPAAESAAPTTVLDRLAQAMFNPPAADALFVPWAAYVTLAAALLAVLTTVLPERARWLVLALCAGMLAAPVWLNLAAGPEVRTTHGIVLASPVVIAAIAGRRDLRGLPLIAGTMLVFVAAQVVLLYAGPSAALEWGPRLPLLIYPLACAWLATFRPPPHAAFGRTALAALALLSVATQLQGIRKLRGDLAGLAALSQRLEAEPAQVIVTDQSWLTAALAPLYLERQFLSVPAEADWAATMDCIAAHYTGPVVYVSRTPERQALISPADSIRLLRDVRAPASARPGGSPH